MSIVLFFNLNEEIIMAYIVRFERAALAAMVMNGLETFLLPMKNKGKKKGPEIVKGHEVFGYIFGRRQEKEKNVHEYTVELINFDITALSSQKSVKLNTETLELKKALAELMLPTAELLGNFHTHPYRLLGDEGETLTDNFGPYMWSPSKTDIKDDSANDFQLDLIMAVINAQRSLKKGTCRLDENCLQFDLDNIRFCLAAYIRRRDEELSYPPYVDSAEVTLKRPKWLWRLPKCLPVADSFKKNLFKI